MTSGYRKLTTVCLAAMLAVGLAACGGGGGTTATPEPPPPDPIEVERKAISDAIAAAGAAAGMVTDASTDAEVMAADAAIAAAMAAINGATHISAGEAATSRASLATVSSRLEAAKSSRTMAMSLASQREAISDAIAAATTAVGAVMDDSADAVVTAAEQAIAAASAAIAAAGDILASEAATERAKVTALQSDLATAKESRQMAMDAADDERQRMEREQRQKTALMTAAGNIDTSDLMTPEAIAAANMAIAALEEALAAATDVSDADKAMYEGRVTAAKDAVAEARSALARAADHDAQTMALDRAVAALQAIDLGNLSTQGNIDAAEAAIAVLEEALAAATELSDVEKSAAMAVLATADRTVMAAQGRVDRAVQMQALSDAVDGLEAIDLTDLMTQAQIDAADEAIVALDLALAAATDLTDAEKLNATVDVTVAKRRVATAKETLATNIEGQREAIMDAVAALNETDLEDLSDQEKIDAAQDAVDALKMALDGATHLTDAAKAMYQTQLDEATETVRVAQTGMDLDERVMAQRTAITDAVTAARAAVGMVDDDATDAQVTAADDAIAALKAAIDGAADLPEGDTDVASAQGTLTTLEGQLTSAKDSRQMALDAKDRAGDAAMIATALKLYNGISAPTGDAAAPAAEDRAAAYNNDATAILVSIGDDTTVPAAPATGLYTLSEDKKATVAALHGWEGKKYADPAGGVMVEAVVYSNVGDPTMGAKFNSGTGDGNVGFDLDGTSGETPVLSTLTGYEERVDSPSFDQSAGIKEFELPTNTVRVMLSGSYYGVSGTYYCTPAADSTCASQKATDGFALGSTLDATNAFTAGGWTFKPTNPEARVTEVADAHYASYGWWIRKSADDKTYTASVFVDEKGTVDDAAGLDTLRGTATYMGGAAGKYALSSSTGGTNDAGHFTARATLEAEFDGTPTITGTIDEFTGADGMSRDWSVELKEAVVAATGAITRIGTDQTNNDTVWTIGEDAAVASGEWSGALRDNGDDGVPKVATGTFYSMYGADGKMVGAFGVNKQ